MKEQAVKIRIELLDALRELKKKEGRFLTWHLNRAVENYLKAKKILKG